MGGDLNKIYPKVSCARFPMLKGGRFMIVVHEIEGCGELYTDMDSIR